MGLCSISLFSSFRRPQFDEDDLIFYFLVGPFECIPFKFDFKRMLLNFLSVNSTLCRDVHGCIW